MLGFLRTDFARQQSQQDSGELAYVVFAWEQIYKDRYREILTPS